MQSFEARQSGPHRLSFGVVSISFAAAVLVRTVTPRPPKDSLDPAWVSSPVGYGDGGVFRELQDPPWLLVPWYCGDESDDIIKKKCGHFPFKNRMDVW